MGIVNRTDFDLMAPRRNPEKEMTVFDKPIKQKSPHVIEPSFGLDRLVFTLLLDAHREEVGEKDADESEGGKARASNRLRQSRKRTRPRPSCRFHHPLRPSVGHPPLMKKDGLAEKARNLSDRKTMAAVYDEAGSIGKRYARMDEAGCPVPRSTTRRWKTAPSPCGSGIGPAEPSQGRPVDENAEPRIIPSTK